MLSLLLLVISFLVLALPTGAEFVHTFVDPTGDVVANPSGQSVTRPSLDIVSVSTSTSGDDLHLLMVLEDRFDASATYLVTLRVEGKGDLYFWMMGGGYTLSNPAGPLNVTGSTSSNGMKLTWVVSLEEAGADTGVDIYGATAYITEGSDTVMDDLSNAVYGGGTQVEVELHVDVTYQFTRSQSVTKIYRMYLEDQEALDVREAMDTDLDGEVNQSEVNVYKSIFKHSDTTWNRTSITYLGSPPDSVNMDVTYEMVLGPTHSKERLVQQIVVTCSFPKKYSNSTEMLDMNHTYNWNDELSWAGSLPLWHVSDESSFTILAMNPSNAVNNYVFMDFGLPAPLLEYMDRRKHEIQMGGAEMRTDWNDTMALVDMMTVHYGASEPRVKYPCSTGIMMPMIAIPPLMLVMRNRPRL